MDKDDRDLCSHGRKNRYAGKVAWPTEGAIVGRGYENRRTDAFDLQSEAQLLVFDKILDNDPDGAIDLAKRIVAEVRDAGHGPDPAARDLPHRHGGAADREPELH